MQPRWAKRIATTLASTPAVSITAGVGEANQFVFNRVASSQFGEIRAKILEAAPQERFIQ